MHCSKEQLQPKPSQTNVYVDRVDAVTPIDLRLIGDMYALKRIEWKQLNTDSQYNTSACVNRYKRPPVISPSSKLFQPVLYWLICITTPCSSHEECPLSSTSSPPCLIHIQIQSLHLALSSTKTLANCSPWSCGWC